MKCSHSRIHGPHVIPRTGETCEGLTSWDIAQRGRRKQEALKNDAHTFATRYSIHVSAQSLRSNANVWREVERALQREYDKGLEAGRGGKCIHETEAEQ